MDDSQIVQPAAITTSEQPVSEAGTEAIAGPALPAIADGSVLTAEDGRAYVVSHLRAVPMVRTVDGQRAVSLEPISLTLRRVIPKVRGKRARREDKRQRAQLRRASAATVAAIAAHAEREVPQVDW